MPFIYPKEEERPAKATGRRGQRGETLGRPGDRLARGTEAAESSMKMWTRFCKSSSISPKHPFHKRTKLVPELRQNPSVECSTL